MRLRDGVRLEGQVEVSVRLNIMDIFIERQIEVRWRSKGHWKSDGVQRAIVCLYFC